ncbi:putative CtpA-like serine protease [Bhargavaea cecembensis DSE10]|uniref:Putative CtpA-like serine protease n=1 Tax=Bhargavaea cecembensis DSE10 TaxID=1235279 RepID=M7NLB7_9BACL|nr:S41 family peptidase [Bhargavaea cecembensis]EMR07926.1 putative CtpA-like serine protease [Bhargavaea cecembensis DSE10]
MLKRSTALFFFLTVLFASQAVHANVIEEIKHYVKNYYYGDIPLYLNEMKTIAEIEAGLDEYSEYLTKKEYEAYLGTLHIPSESWQLTGDLPGSEADSHVMSRFLFGNTGYIAVSRFQVETPIAVIREWEKLKGMGARQLILDLRYNGGGSVGSAEKIIGMFQNAPEAYTRHNREESIRVKSVPAKIKFPQNPYVLVNKYSASASELVAAAIKDQQAGTVVGQKTYGKGSIQSFFELSDGGAMKLTTAHFIGPGGTKIQSFGVMPDEETPPGKELQFAHTALSKGWLTEQGYSEFPDAEMEAPGKSFTITFSQKMNFSAPAASNRVELIRMGDAITVPVKVEQTGDLELKITPEKPLLSNSVYALVIHPRFADREGIYMRKGAYLFIKTI